MWGYCPFYNWKHQIVGSSSGTVGLSTCMSTGTGGKLSNSILRNRLAMRKPQLLIESPAGFFLDSFYSVGCYSIHLFPLYWLWFFDLTLFLTKFWLFLRCCKRVAGQFYVQNEVDLKI